MNRKIAGTLLVTVLLLVGCGPVADPAEVPPAGEVWFGSTFDPDTFEISGRTDTVTASETFALVATLPETVDASELMLRATHDGIIVSTEEANAEGTGQVWGFTYGPVGSAGQWTIEFLDIGGNVLAAGTVTASD